MDGYIIVGSILIFLGFREYHYWLRNNRTWERLYKEADEEIKSIIANFGLDANTDIESGQVEFRKDHLQTILKMGDFDHIPFKDEKELENVYAEFRSQRKIKNENLAKISQKYKELFASHLI